MTGSPKANTDRNASETAFISEAMLAEAEAIRRTAARAAGADAGHCAHVEEFVAPRSAPAVPEGHLVQAAAPVPPIPLPAGPGAYAPAGQGKHGIARELLAPGSAR